MKNHEYFTIEYDNEYEENIARPLPLSIPWLGIIGTNISIIGTGKTEKDAVIDLCKNLIVYIDYLKQKPKGSDSNA